MVKQKIKVIIFIFILTTAFTCSSNKPDNRQTNKKYFDLNITDSKDYLVAVTKEGSFEFGSPVAFINVKGDTIIPYGKYSSCWTDTLTTYAIVLDNKNTNGKVVAIDRYENILFDIYLFDNAPDEPNEGLFRVKRYNKIGFVDEKGIMVIPCQFECAFRFENGKAKVAYHCIEQNNGEHKSPESDEWIYIDKNGRVIK